MARVTAAVASGHGGALLAWTDSYNGTVLQMVDASIGPLGNATVLPPADVPQGLQPVNFARRTALKWEGGWWLAMEDGAAVYGHTVDPILI